MTRIPLRIEDSRLILATVIDCPSLRIHKKYMDFAIDTGSVDSYLSDRDVDRFRIPINKPAKQEVDLGGSRFKQVKIPKMTLYCLKEDKVKNDHVELKVSMGALKTTKKSEKKKLTAQSLPNILGINFLREQLMSLHVILTEEMAYLQFEG